MLKFSITEFSTEPEIVWLDSAFYELHDEWYWFQLLNGDAVRGFDTEPIDGLAFATVAEVYEWADARRANLPLDLQFTPLDRLYSPEFYDLGLDTSPDRRLGLGALIRSPGDDASPDDDRWTIELEFSDEVTVEQIEVYFAVVAGSLPTEIVERLTWVPRSRIQEQTAAALEASTSVYARRVVRYDDLVEPGTVEVYSPAVAAGRLLLVTEGGRWSLGDAGPDDIVAIDVTPDDLPPGNGLITGTPQTPLAHVNVLALNRGIPNAHLGGLAEDPLISQLGRVRAPVLVHTTIDGELDVFPLADEEYDGWLDAQRREPIAVPRPDATTLPLTVTLDDLPAQGFEVRPDRSDVRPVIGGKATGFIDLAAAGDVTIPRDAMAITIRPYVAHMARFAATVEAITTDPDLADSPRLRHLVLEGREDYDERHPGDRDRELADEFVAGHPAGTPIGDALAADGFRRLVRDTPIDAATLGELTAELAARFSAYSPTQGLRFRSSSTVEDIEGFNGAGLYDSNTRFIDPSVLADPGEHDRTVERAILRTWSSYWGAVAYEERERERIEHASGSMAVLVHARFDDELEAANGVATVTLNPSPELRADVAVNVQEGATSVTNPDDVDGPRPDVLRIVVDRDDVFEAELVASDSDRAAPVLDDAELLDLSSQLLSVADTWLARERTLLPPSQAPTTVTLDFEFKFMADGWPAYGDDREPAPARLVVKQVRTLDPGLRGVPVELLALPLPRDVIEHAISATRFDCGPGEPSGVRLRLDPSAAIDFGAPDETVQRWTAGGPLNGVPVGDLLDAPPDGTDPDSCAMTTLLEQPTQYLLELLAARS